MWDYQDCLAKASQHFHLLDKWTEELQVCEQKQTDKAIERYINLLKPLCRTSQIIDRKAFLVVAHTIQTKELGWYHRSYGLTDQRIIDAGGVRPNDYIGTLVKYSIQLKEAVNKPKFSDVIDLVSKLVPYESLSTEFSIDEVKIHGSGYVSNNSSFFTVDEIAVAGCRLNSLTLKYANTILYHSIETHNSTEFASFYEIFDDVMDGLRIHYGKAKDLAVQNGIIIGKIEDILAAEILTKGIMDQRSLEDTSWNMMNTLRSGSSASP